MSFIGRSVVAKPRVLPAAESLERRCLLSTSGPPGGTTGWVQTFDEEFGVTTLDTSKWSNDYTYYQSGAYHPTPVHGASSAYSLAANTPAYEQGLNTGDQIVAIDGYRATNAFLQSYLAERKPSDTVKLTVFRFDKLREVGFKLGANMRANYSFAPVAQPSEDQKRLYADYMKAELGK